MDTVLKTDWVPRRETEKLWVCRIQRGLTSVGSLARRIGSVVSKQTETRND